MLFHRKAGAKEPEADEGRDPLHHGNSFFGPDSQVDCKILRTIPFRVGNVVLLS